MITANFSPVLESVVDDMRNSLGLMTDSLMDSQIDVLGYELFRINSGLQHLQNLYRLQSDQLVINYEECFLQEFIEDEVMAFAALLEAKGIRLAIDCEASFSWFLDEILVRNILSSVLLNTIRYCKSEIRISAIEEFGQLMLTVEDDGCGYPTDFLIEDEQVLGMDYLSRGSAGVNLFFSVHVASLHKNNGRSGAVRVTNSSSLGGGCFTLQLP